MKTMLLHTCCAPCLIAPYSHIKDLFDITIFWWNHNIHPVAEYFARRNALRQFVQQNNIKYIEHDEYGLIQFLKDAQDAENRCVHCYAARMRITANIAKSKGFDCWSTTLLYSIHQKHDLLISIGQDIATKSGVEFYYQDFREYFVEGKELAKACDMYRQKYCGCIFSEMERYAPIPTPTEET